MASNETPEQEIERLLQEHFSAEAEELRAPTDPWDRLESRLGDQADPPRFRWFRDWFLPSPERRFTPALATAAVAVVAVVVVASVWLSGGDRDENGSSFERAAVPAATAAPAAVLERMQDSTGTRSDSGPSGRDGQTTANAPSATEAPAAASLPTPPPMAAATPQPTRPRMAPAATIAPAAEPIRLEESLQSGSDGAAGPAGPAGSGGGAGPFSIPKGDSGAGSPQKTSPPSIPEPQREPSATTFQKYERQPFVDTREDSVSTFSLDTDRTSYQLALNWATQGYEIDPASVRAEEWVNAFDYGYSPPRNGDRFAITADVMTHPLDGSMRLARVAFQAPELRDDTPLNVTLVLDASGSMSQGNRVAIAREAAETIRRSLSDRDRIAVVHFTDDVIRDLTVEHDRPDDRDVERSIARLAPYGSTNVQAGLDLGVRLADRARRERPEAFNYVILMSDGVANVDATNPFGILESAYDPDARNPLRIITIGVGIENYNDYLMEQIAQHGNGWYRYLSTTDQARTTFARQNWLALSIPFADQTRAQVIWDPAVVKAWRIIGYENRVTPDETFTQDRKEFAEIPSGAATTVFYELELHRGLRDGRKIGNVEVRWLAPKTGMSKSQHSEVRFFGSSQTAAGPMLEFGAIVALLADRYSGLGHSYHQEWERELTVLRDRAHRLHGELGNLQAYQDFVFLLEHIARDIHPNPTEGRSSGYSR